MNNLNIDTYVSKYKKLLPKLDERSKRLTLAADAKTLGWGGVEFVHKASGISRKTIANGIKELDAETSLPEGKSRREGGGRKKLTDNDKTLLKDLEESVSESTRGDPESPLKWACKSVRNLAEELNKKGHKVSYGTVATLLKKELGYSLQGNAKNKEGTEHVDRDKQFRYINELSKKFLKTGDPLISVDTKKKELVGNHKNNGRIWLPKGKPIEVNVYDFPKKDKKAIPYGVLDIKGNQGYVNVGITHDTAEFAVESVRRWWKHLGKKRYPRSKKLMITADAGGSNGYRSRLWKRELQKLANETGMDITVCHYPPGTSKWNKIEHKLFSFISINWRGRPLTDYEVIINLISSTKTRTGLKVYAVLDDNRYKLGKKVADEEMSKLRIDKHKFHGEWNYTIKAKK